jgi:excinuclease ABC subunit B
VNSFRVVSEFEPAGDQPQAIVELARGLTDGLRDQTLLGVTGSGKTYTIAKVVEELQRPTLVLAPNKTLAAQLAAEIRDFMPDNAVVYFVSYYDYYQPEAYVPTTDTFIEKDASINAEVEKLRHAATAALLSRRDVVVVASVSCIYGIGSPEDYAGMAVFVTVGAGYDRDKFIRDLIEIQYDRNDYDVQRGMFRVRGDVIDVFPPYADHPVRVEFFGDDVESVTEVDRVSGEVLTTFESVPIWPATHYVTAPDRLHEGLASIREELRIRLGELREVGKLLEAQRLEMRTSYDLEMLEQMGFCSGIENYSRHLDGRAAGEPPSTLIDYFPDDFLCIVDESHVTIPQLHGMYEGDRSRKLTLVEHGFRLPSALDNRPLRFEEFRARVPQTVFVSATPGDWEIKTSAQVVEQIIRPTGLVDPAIVVRPTANQIDDLIGEVRDRAERDERVLVTTLTKKMAEDLTEYLLEHGIKVRYIHADIGTFERVDILRELRAGVIDCLVGINLLREGLDLPEVSLVAVLDADKAGFLRNHRSLIQTIGRAARNVSGQVILYADKMTEAMRLAIDETDRRRTRQTEFNTEHGIEPKTIRKAIHDIAQYVRETEAGLEPSADVARELAALPRSELARIIATMEEEMHGAADALDFESAARMRDQVVKLKAEVESATAEDVLARLKQGARKGSAHGVRKRKR